LDVFRRIEFTFLNCGNVAINFTGFSVLLLVPYYLATQSGLEVGLAGVVLAMSPLGVVLASPMGGWSMGKVAANRLAFLGVLLVGGGTFLVGRWDGTPGMVAMALPLLMSGVGLGLFQVAYMNIVTGTLPLSDRGVAGSLAMLTRTIGIVGAASLLTWLFASLEAGNIQNGESPDQNFIHSFQLTFDFASAVLIGFLLISLIRPGTWFGRTTEGTQS
jgi:MFS family permease